MASRTKSTRRGKNSGWRANLTTDRVIIGGAIGLTAVFILLVIVSGLANQEPEINLAAVPENAVPYEIQSRDHIEVGASHPAYNSNPPTGGWHYAQPASRGIYTEGLPDESVVHTLEHGHIWLTYRDADDEAALDALTEIQRRYPDNVIITYRPENDSRIAAASWGWLLTLDELDMDQLAAFVVRHRNRAPETVPM
jgi:hypothetical protein